VFRAVSRNISRRQRRAWRLRDSTARLLSTAAVRASAAAAARVSATPAVRTDSQNTSIFGQAQGPVSFLRMRSHTEYLTFHTKKHREYVHITPQVEAAVTKSGVREGMALVSAMHITAGVYVNDNESGLIADIDQWLESLAPFRQDYRHHQTGEDNGDSHLKAILVHHQVILPITAGKLDLGTWQRVFYAEFDGQRSKRVIIKVIGE